MPTYKIIRVYESGEDHKVIKTGLTKDEAIAHAQNPENDSRTCKHPDRKQITAFKGSWSDRVAPEG